MSPPDSPPKPSRARDRGAIALVLVGSLLAVVAMLSVWVREQALNTEVWVETSTELLADPAIQTATATFVADQISSAPQTQEALRRILPQQLDPFAATAAGLLGDAAERATLRGLKSGQFQALWERSNELAHEQLIATIDGRTVLGRGLVLDLRPIVGRVGTRIGLGAGVANAIPEDRGVVRILPPEEVEKVQNAAKLLRGLAWVSTAGMLLFLLGGVALARRRRHTLVVAGMGLVVTGLLVLAARRWGGDALVEAAAGSGPTAAAAHATLDIATQLLRQVGRMVVLLGALTALGAWLLGPARLAVAFRAAVVPQVRRHRPFAHAAVFILILLIVVNGLLPWSATIIGPVVYLAAGALFVEGLRASDVPELDDLAAEEPAPTKVEADPAPETADTAEPGTTA